MPPFFYFSASHTSVQKRNVGKLSVNTTMNSLNRHERLLFCFGIGSDRSSKVSYTGLLLSA